MSTLHGGGLRVGDSVTVPGNMHGTLKFIGPVAGKKGTFAGVQLSSEFAARGKNNGDVDGKHYFRTTVPGSGIFLPVDRAEKRVSSGTSGSSGSGTRGLGLRMSSVTGSPGTPGGNGFANYNQGTRTPGQMGSSKPATKFSQSIGPGSLARAPSPAGLKPPLRRESLPRPASPIRPRPSSPTRKTNNPSRPGARTPATGRLQTPKTRPSIGFNRTSSALAGNAPAGSRSPDARGTSSAAANTNKFSQSLRQSQPARPKTNPNSSTALAISSPLGPEDRFDEYEESTLSIAEHDTTPTPAAGRNVDMVSGMNSNKHELEVRQLKADLEQRDRQLTDQASSIAEMERNLVELSKLLPALEANGLTDFARSVPQLSEGELDLPKDVQTLRATLREKNDRIRALTAEFDNNRADFRSTIDTLEMASTETERVYEQRIDELLDQVRTLQDRSEDVEGVAQQFKQLEELVQELEEGLEDARRGEAEARGEVEFLRGEVERGRSELRRERERNAAKDQLEGTGDGADLEELEEIHRALTQKDDEIRGLKVIIQSMQKNTARSPSRNGRPAVNGYGSAHSKTKSISTVVSAGAGDDTESVLQKQIHDLESLLEQKSFEEEKLQSEVRELRKSVQFGKKSNTGGYGPVGSTGLSHKRTNSEVEKHRSAGSTRTVTGSSPYQHRRKDTGIPGQEDVVEALTPQQATSPLKAEFSIDVKDSDVPDMEPRRRSASMMKSSNTNSNNLIQKSPSVSGQTDNSSTAPPWCEICEETGHDILSCGSMFGNNTDKNRLSSGSQIRNGQDVVREGLRRSHESALGPNRTSINNRNINGATAVTTDVDRPAPLRKSSTYSNSGNPVSQKTSFNSGSTASPSLLQTTTEKPTLPPDEPLPDPPSMNTTANSFLTQFKPPTQATPGPQSKIGDNTTLVKPTLIEGTGDQAGMLAGKSSGVINPDKWCALCERDGHDSVDCPIEDAF